MIIFDRLLKAGGGNFGNCLWEIAGCLGLAKRYGTIAKFPENSLFQYFKNPPESYSHEDWFLQVEEKTYKFDWEQWDDYRDMFQDFTINIKGWLQDSRYFEGIDIHKLFELKEEYVSWIRAKYHYVFTKPTIAISSRRGDYVKNESYHLLPIRYYLGALLKYFPDFRDNYNLVIFSDDVEYCKLHFGCLSNVFYAQGDAIEQHTLMRQCENFILSNSTFSYWGAKLAKSPKKVIVPKYLFAGRLLEKEGDVNFWTNEVQTKGWIEFDHTNFKIDLSDTTFTIPTFHDSSDRDENISLSIKLLKEDFHCKIIVGENISSSFSHLGDRYMKFSYKEFWRTRMLNQMTYKATTPIIFNWDADIAISPLQILEAVRLIRSGYDMAYPYDGRFARVPRTHYQDISELRDVGILGGKRFNGMNLGDKMSVGGAIAFNKNSFIEGGGENEFFKSYGPEDQERFYRFTTLGYKVARIPGTLYHIDHKITTNSSMQHPHYKANEAEWEKVQKMDKESLRAYVDSWDFTSDYEETYHSDIYDTASPQIILSQLEEWIDFKSIIDVGCGNGSWNTGKYQYTGVDFCASKYILADLRKPLNLEETWDLAICLEMAEHLPEKYADTLILNLTKLSNQILFSAAIPGQDGESHLNCQWQSYWAKKFEDLGFYPYYKDIRIPIWDNYKVAPWYRQNTVLYTNNLPTRQYDLDKIHPKMYLNLLTTN